MASGGGDFQVASLMDRISADVASQANMIRSAINNCNLQYVMAQSMIQAEGGIPPTSDPYPATQAPSLLVSALVCTPTDQSSLWGANTGILLPQPTKGFSPWYYINDSGNGGGRCIWTVPLESTPLSDSGLVAGLTRAASKFNYSPTVTLTNEVVYDPAGASQKFVVWITMPASIGSANIHCQP
jgi:hypothetical protein